MVDAVTQAINSFDAVTKQLEQLQKDKLALEQQILAHYNDQLKQQLGGKDYGCGTATVLAPDGRELKIEIGKNVKWDQPGLEALYKQIAAAGRDPGEYIKAKYEVSETAYKAWPSEIRDAFTPHRTVTPSKPKLTIKS